MSTKRKRIPEVDAEIQEEDTEAEMRRIREALQAFDEAACKTDPVQKSIAEDEDGEWQALRLANKAADEALKKAIDNDDGVAIDRARNMTKKAKQDIINAELRAKSAARRITQKIKKKARRFEAAEEPVFDDLELKAICKARKKQNMAKAAERSKAEDIEEMNQLCNALVLRENPPTRFPEKTELIMLSQLKKRRNKVESVDVWLTWPQCRVCGSRRPDEEQLHKHWQFEHQFGARGSAKRNKIKSELSPYLQFLSGNFNPAPLLINESEESDKGFVCGPFQPRLQDASSTNCSSTPPVTIKQEDSDDEIEYGLPTEDALGHTSGENAPTANDSSRSPLANKMVVQAFSCNHFDTICSSNSNNMQ